MKTVSDKSLSFNNKFGGYKKKEKESQKEGQINCDKKQLWKDVLMEIISWNSSQFASNQFNQSCVNQRIINYKISNKQLLKSNFSGSTYNFIQFRMYFKIITKY